MKKFKRDHEIIAINCNNCIAFTFIMMIVCRFLFDLIVFISYFIKISLGQSHYFIVQSSIL